MHTGYTKFDEMTEMNINWRHAATSE